VYRSINNGVYRAGFATSQAGYEVAVGEMHSLMAALNDRLSTQRFLLGDRCVGRQAAPRRPSPLCAAELYFGLCRNYELLSSCMCDDCIARPHVGCSCLRLHTHMLALCPPTTNTQQVHRG
jgi:hypothetical protein